MAGFFLHARNYITSPTATAKLSDNFLMSGYYPRLRMKPAGPREKWAFSHFGGMRRHPRLPFIPASSAPPETSREKLRWHFPSKRYAVFFQLGLYALQQATHGGNHITKRQTSCVWKFLLIPTPIFFLHMALGNAIKYGRNATKNLVGTVFLGTDPAKPL